MAIKAIFFDAAGTLIKPARRVGETYAVLARKYCIEVSAAEVSSADTAVADLVYAEGANVYAHLKKPRT